MTSFIEALQNFNFDAVQQAQGVNITLGNGNNTVTVVGDDSSVTAGNGNNKVTMTGDDDSILLGDGNNTVKATGNNNAVVVGDGNNTIDTKGKNTLIMAGDASDPSSKGNNVIHQDGDGARIAVGNGDNRIYSYSNGAIILAGDGDNTIGSLGNNVRIGVGDGDNNIAFWGENDVMILGDGNNNVKSLDYLHGGPVAADEESRKYNEKFALPSDHTLNGMNTDADLMKMSDKVWSSFQSRSEKTTAVTGSYTSPTTYTSYTSGNWRYTYGHSTTTTSYLDTTRNYLDVTGIKNLTIVSGDGDNDIYVNRDGYQWQQSVNRNTYSKDTYNNWLAGSTWIGRTYDPLVIDYNGDGKVSAAKGQGIDLDGDGKADGAATNGDKMLAMSDINGNGKIDGAEVFGNNTVDPFTGKSLNAKNGFDALAKLAESAEANTTYKCIDADGNVDLQALKQALATKGIQLGFVSDANDSMIEELNKIVSINVKDYTESGETEGQVHHAQQGTAIDENGNKVKAHDVWFQEN